MAEETQTLTLNVRVNDLASAQLATIGDAAQKAANGVEASGNKAATAAANWGKIGTSMTNVGRTMSEYITAPILAVGGAAIKSAADFQTWMTRIQGETGTSAGDIQKLSDGLLKLGQNSVVGPTELAESMYLVQSAGFSVKDSLAAVDVVQKEVAISGASAKDTTDGLVGAMYSQIKGAQNAHDAMATLNAIVGAGKMQMQDLNGAMGTMFLSTAQQYGVSLSDVGGALDVMVDRGASAESAATRLRMAMMLMATPSKQAAGVLADMGLSAKDAADQSSAFAQVLAKTGVTTTQLAEDMRTKGLNGTLHELHDRLVQLTGSAPLADAALSKAFGGSKTSSGIGLLTDNLDSYDAKLKQISATTGDFDKSAQAASNTLNNQVKISLNAVQDALVKAVDGKKLQGVTDMVKGLGNALVGLINWFSGLSPGMQKFVIDLALIVAAVGPVLMVVGKLITTFKEIKTIMYVAGAAEGEGATGLIPMLMAIPAPAWIVIGVIAAVAAAAYLIYKNWGTISKFFGDMWRDIEGFFTKHWQAILLVVAPMILLPIEIMKHWGQITAFFGQLFSDLGVLFRNIFDLFTGGDPTTTHGGKLPWTDFMVQAMNVRDAITKFITDIPADIGRLVTAVDNAWKKFIGLFTMKNADHVAFDLGKILGEMVRHLIDFTTKDIPNWYNATISWFAKLPGEISNYMNQTWKNIATYWTNIYNESVRDVTNMYNSTVSWFSKLPAAVGNWMNNTYNAVAGWFVRMWNDTATWTQNMYNSVTGWFARLPGAIAGWAVGVYNAAVNMAKNIWNGIASEMGKLPGQVQGVWNNVINTITGWSGALYNKAKSIAGSFWNGFKEGLGIHSPSYIEKAFVAIGAQSNVTLTQMNRDVSRLNGLANTINNKSLANISGAQLNSLAGAANGSALGSSISTSNTSSTNFQPTIIINNNGGNGSMSGWQANQAIGSQYASLFN